MTNNAIFISGNKAQNINKTKREIYFFAEFIFKKFDLPYFDLWQVNITYRCAQVTFD